MFLHAAKDMFVYNHAPEYLVLLKILFMHANLCKPQGLST